MSHDESMTRSGRIVGTTLRVLGIHLCGTDLPACETCRSRTRQAGKGVPRRHTGPPRVDACLLRVGCAALRRESSVRSGAPDCPEFITTRSIGQQRGPHRITTASRQALVKASSKLVPLCLSFARSDFSTTDCLETFHVGCGAVTHH